MRHDPAGASIVIMLRSLKLYGMANAVEDLAAQGAPAFEAATPLLSQLLKAEIAEREVRSIAYHSKVARFPAYKDLTGFDFTSSEINEATVRQLHRCEFIEAAENVVLIGGPSSIGLEPMAPSWTTRQKPHGHRNWCSSYRASQAQGSLLLHSRTGQCPGARKSAREGWKNG